MTGWKFRVTDIPPNIDLLCGLKPQDIDLILAAGRPHRFPAKSVMTYQGYAAEHLLLLWKGRARYFYETNRYKKLILKWIAPGDCFGEAALVSGPSNYLVSTEAVWDGIVVEWSHKTIRALARRYPLLLENALRIDMSYVSWYVSAHAALISEKARQRLASILFGLATSVGQKVSGGIELDVTNEELAESANITRYTTSRLISEWQKAGTIRKHKGKILLRSAEGPLLRAR
jgi:CRP-like cAMP-binding protein